MTIKRNGEGSCVSDPRMRQGFWANTKKSNERKRRITEAVFRIRNLLGVPDPDPYNVGTESGSFNLYKQKKETKIWFLQYWDSLLPVFLKSGLTM